MRILVIEDEPRILSFLERGLEAEGFSVDGAADGKAGIARAVQGSYDLVILDLLLPKLDGFAVLRQLQHRLPELPVVIVSARSELETKLQGFDLGACDYLSKPFSFDELLARVRALLRRGAPPRPTVLAVGKLRLDPSSHRAWNNGDELALTPREYALLEMFMRHPG
jgi:two-component system OmpR family response regulator